MTDLCIGTAQFGMDYGITNDSGKISEIEAKRILDRAADYGISFIDTAQCYGNSQRVIGRALRKDTDIRVISKVARDERLRFEKRDVLKWQDSAQEGLRELRIDSYDTMLVHSANDIKKPGSEYLIDWLMQLRDSGLCHRVGLSIYDGSDLESIDISWVDVVQVPLSLFDQRLITDRTISNLHAQGIKVHVRSIFMQGLLLSHSCKWPEWMPSSVKSHHDELLRLAESKDTSILEMALGFIKEQKEVETALIGVCRMEELDEIVSAWNSTSPWVGKEWQGWGWEDKSVIDPRRWPR